MNSKNLFHPHVVPNLYGILSSVLQKQMFTEGQDHSSFTLTESFLQTMKVNNTEAVIVPPKKTNSMRGSKCFILRSVYVKGDQAQSVLVNVTYIPAHCGVNAVSSATVTGVGDGPCLELHIPASFLLLRSHVSISAKLVQSD